MKAPFTIVALGVALVVALALALALAAGGCQVFDKRPAAETPPDAETPEPAAAADLSTVIDHLERGEAQRARAVLVELREKAPGSELVERLLAQIDAPLEELLPGPYRQVEVAPGDTLSQIAARELGDPLLFYALARLNGIEAPARIPAGTILRMPDSSGARSDRSQAASKPGRLSAQEIDTVAVHLARSGQHEQARRMLVDWLAEGDQAPELVQRRLVEITLEQVSGAGSEGPAEQALAVVDEALSVVNAATARARLVQMRSTLRVRELYQTARQLQAQGDLQAAHARASEAAALDPGAQQAKRLAESLAAELVDSLHGQALVAWRERDVDLAIRKWAALLEIAPDFEPARIYIERAKRLRRRLEQP